MSLQQNIDQDIKSAMLSKDSSRLRGLRAIKAALLVAKTEKGAELITEDTEIKVLQRLVKQRKESAEIYQTQNRQDLYQIELEELQVIEAYLPKQMDKDEIRAHISEVIKRIGAAGMKDMGKVMGIVNKDLSGKADGKSISELVKLMLA